MLARSVAIRGGGNQRTRGKPPTLDGRTLPCHMPTPGFDPGSQRWQASALTTALSLYINDDPELILTHFKTISNFAKPVVVLTVAPDIR